ncbi:MAG: hypothetical protein KDK38_04870 [Leptospiraceae bacterium]|nr:hypothetical protein [Leptospiraceae bacterium]
MIEVVKDWLFQIVNILNLCKGMVFLFVTTLPVSIFLIAFIGIMAGGSPPADKSKISPFLITSVMIIGTPIFIFIISILSGKILDALVKTTPFNQWDVSVLGLGFGSLVVVILGNIFIDNGFQAKQGSYSVSFFALIIIELTLVLIKFLGKINLPF